MQSRHWFGDADFWVDNVGGVNKAITRFLRYRHHAPRASLSLELRESTACSPLEQALPSIRDEPDINYRSFCPAIRVLPKGPSVLKRSVHVKEASQGFAAKSR